MLPFRAILKLTRIWNLIIIGLAQYATAGFLISTTTLDEPRLLLLVISTLMIAAGGYIINDYYDIKIDLINKPERVVVGKEMPRRYAILFHTLLSFGGSVLGFFLDWKIGVLNFISAFLLWLYSNALKRMPLIGNLTVALLSGMSILLVNVLFPPMLTLVWIYALFSFIMSLVREIIKDMEDLQGDNTFGCKTLPIVWGIPRTKLVTYLFLVLFVGTVITVHELLTPLPVLYFTGFLFVPTGILMIWLGRADTKKDFNLLSQFCKVILLAGVVSMAFL